MVRWILNRTWYKIKVHKVSVDSKCDLTHRDKYCRKISNSVLSFYTAKQISTNVAAYLSIPFLFPQLLKGRGWGTESLGSLFQSLSRLKPMFPVVSSEVKLEKNLFVRTLTFLAELISLWLEWGSSCWLLARGLSQLTEITHKSLSHGSLHMTSHNRSLLLQNQ